MPRHEEQTVLPYGAEELFSVVANVSDYPSFIPWCKGAHIRREEGHQIIADLVIGFGPFQESFTSEVTLERPRKILVRAIEGPLEHLTNSWTFRPMGHKTHVDFVIDFQFKSHLLDHAANGMFHEASTRIVTAFEAHVHSLDLMRHHTKGH
jgi:coenzyme Q-binding protein COQ10